MVKDDVVYELKYVSKLSHENFLQCACCIIALGLKKGILWNTKDNSMFEINDSECGRFPEISIGEGIIKKIYFSEHCLLITVQHMSNPPETNTYDLKTSLEMGFIKI